MARVSLVILVAAVLIVVGRAIESYVRTAKAFEIRAIELEGNEKLTRAEVLTLAKLRVGQNIFEVSPEAVEGHLLADARLAEAEAIRRLPDSITLRVKEHKPVALLALNSLYFVSDAAKVFKSVAEGDEVDLPLITGADRARFTSDPNYRDEVLETGVALLRDYRSAGLWAAKPLSEIHFEADGGVSLYVGEGGTLERAPVYVRLGAGPHGRKLRRLRMVFERVADSGGALEYVYLDNVRRPERATLRLR